MKALAEEQTEQPGKNAVEHSCEMKVENPEEQGQFVKCRILAILQCSNCSAWICGTEELEHAIVCVRCDVSFCPVCYPAHRLENRCHEVAG